MINLDRCPKRWSDFESRADAVGIIGYQRYRAVDGDQCPHPEWWRAGNGAWGCLMTHLRIAQDSMMDGLESYLVFEDDVIFREDFRERLLGIMDQIGKLEGQWDMLYLGGQHLYEETFPPYPFRDGLVRCANVNRTHAFVVNARFMQKFAQHIIHAPDYLDNYLPEVKEEDGSIVQEEYMRHIDHQLGEIHRRVITLAAFPWLCGQAEGPSEISGGINKENWWDDNGWGK